MRKPMAFSEALSERGVSAGCEVALSSAQEPSHESPREPSSRDVCPVCLVPIDAPDEARMPGCRHPLHAACMINVAQFDVRCPICRHVDSRVVAKTPVGGSSVLEQVIRQQTEHETLQRAYMRRRSRCIRADPDLRLLRERVDAHTCQYRGHELELERAWYALQRAAWAGDPTIAAIKRARSRCLRNVTRNRKILEARVEARIGPGPTLSPTFGAF